MRFIFSHQTQQIQVVASHVASHPRIQAIWDKNICGRIHCTRPERYVDYTGTSNTRSQSVLERVVRHPQEWKAPPRDQSIDLCIADFVLNCKLFIFTDTSSSHIMHEIHPEEWITPRNGTDRIALAIWKSIFRGFRNFFYRFLLSIDLHLWKSRCGIT